MKKMAVTSLVLLFLAGHSWGQSIQMNAYGPGVHMDQFGRPVTMQPAYGGSTIPPAKSGGALALYQAWQQQKARDAAEEENEAGRNWLINYQAAQSPEERMLRRQQLPNVVKNVEKIIFLESYADKFDQHRMALESNGSTELQQNGEKDKALAQQLVGTWNEVGSFPDGTPAEGKTTYNDDGTFILEIRMASDSMPDAMQFSGNWTVNNSYLICTIMDSNLAEFSADGQVMKDKVLSVDQEKLVTLSEVNGKVETAFRSHQ